MGFPLSLRTRANTAFALTILGIALLGAMSFSSISAFTRETTDIRERWLRDTQYLGDLANYTSDLRAAEGEQVDRARGGLPTLPVADLRELYEQIARAMGGFQQQVHGGREQAIYAQFLRHWSTYLKIAGPPVEIGADAAGILKNAAGFVSTSKAAYTAASDDLALLTTINNADARSASARANTTIENARLLGALTILASLALVIGILVYTERSMMGPLVVLAAAMQRLSNGEFDVEIPAAKRQDEVGRMACAVMVFRDNAVKLREARERLAWQALHLQGLLAQEQHLGEQHRTFMSMASHEFRTPMTIIDGHAQRLINATESATRDAVVKRAKKIRVAIKGMSFMIDYLVETGRILDSHQPIAFRSDTFDLRLLVEEVCALHEEIGQGVEIERATIGEPLAFPGDRQMLALALHNLLSNAIKYSIGDKHVHVALDKIDDRVQIGVADSGIGIAETDIYRVFDRYYRGRNALSISGSGLGLFIVKSIIERHGGSIYVDSSVDRGTTFTLDLPIRSPATRSFEVASAVI